MLSLEVYRIASLHHITSHHIASHHITSHHITSHHITSHHITSHHITSHHITSHRLSLPDKHTGGQLSSLACEDGSHSNTRHSSLLHLLYGGVHAIAGRMCESALNRQGRSQRRKLCKSESYQCRSTHSSACSETEACKCRLRLRRKASLGCNECK